jgi:hypothetical protein
MLPEAFGILALALRHFSHAPVAIYLIHFRIQLAGEFGHRGEDHDNRAPSRISGIMPSPNWRSHKPVDRTIISIVGHVSQRMLAHYVSSLLSCRIEAKRKVLDALAGDNFGKATSPRTVTKQPDGAISLRKYLKRIAGTTGLEPAASANNGLVDWCAANRDTTIACSVIQPEGPANRWPGASPTGSRWRHWRLFEQRIRRPRFARGRRYGISG